MARGAGRGQPGQHQGAGGAAARPRRPGRARGRDRTGTPATALLLRLRPDGGGGPAGPLRGDGETATEAAVRLVLALRGSYLPIQGPPGTGKTYTAAQQILELIKAGRTVGITGPSHAVIHNLIGEVCERADEPGVVRPRIGQRAEQDTSYLHPDAAGLEHDSLENGPAGRRSGRGRGHGLDVGPRSSSQGSVDTLFVDEAGQMSLANVLAVAGAARNLVLLGDPQQLAQPSQAAHPPGRASRRWSTSWATTRRCPRTQACSSTRPGGCTRSCASTPRRLLRREADRRRRARAPGDPARDLPALRGRLGPAESVAGARTRGTRTPRRRRPTQVARLVCGLIGPGVAGQGRSTAGSSGRATSSS